jgi:uncharacterized protein
MASDDDTSRLELVDSLRGLGLLGLFLVHCVEKFELYWANPTGGPVFDWVFGLFSGKSYALFALCFGLSFFLIMDGAARRGVDFRGRFVWRLVLLLLIGVVHGLVYRGDILVVLATLGLIMPIFDRIRSNRLLLVLAGLCFLQLPLLMRAVAASTGVAWAIHAPLFTLDGSMPVLTGGSFSDVLRANLVAGQISKWSFYAETGRLTQIVGLFLIGLVIGRTGFFRDVDRHRLTRRAVLLASVVTALLFWFAGPLALHALVAAEAPSRPHLQWALDSWTDLSIMTVEVLLFVELFGTATRPLLRTLAAPGRMTLSLYVGQSLVFVPVFYGYGLGWWDVLTLSECLWIGIGTFALQIFAAHWWFRHFRFGPLEWLWRVATRTTLDVPFRIPEAVSA